MSYLPRITKNKLTFFFAICFLQSLSANLVHPVTPTLIINLNLPSYMFGLAFSTMALTNFLFSPFWGKMVEKIGCRKVFLICSIGYAVGQFIFSRSTGAFSLLFARIFAGVFLGGIAVSKLTHTINSSSEDKKSSNLTILATTMAVGGAIGYLIGGLIGNINIYHSFNLQVCFLFLSGILFYIIIGKQQDEEISLNGIKTIFIESAHLKSVLGVNNYKEHYIAILSIIVFISTVSTVCHDQNFNYYIKAVYDFPPSINGIIKAVVAIIAFIFNTTVCVYIIKRLDIKSALVKLFIVMTINAICIFFVGNMQVFLTINIIYYGLNSVYVPLVQYLFSNSSKTISTAVLMGNYNSLKSLGMIFGALVSGFAYDIGEKFPFLISGILFLICGIILLYGIKSSKFSNETNK